MTPDQADEDEFDEWMPGEFQAGRLSIMGDTVVLQSDDKLTFDELVIETASVHLEMMDDGTMWMSFQPEGRRDRIVVIASARKRGQLTVKVEKDIAA